MSAKSLSHVVAASAAGCLAALLATTAARAENCDGAVTSTKLEVQVDGVRSGRGLMAVTLYPDDPNRFLRRHGSLRVVRVTARAPSVTVCLYLPGPGGYGVAVYHDENGNRHLDKNGFLPAEGSGLSNNPKVNLFHLPSLKNSRFATHAGENRIEIGLRYPN